MAIKIQGVTIINDTTTYINLAGTSAVKVPAGTESQRTSGGDAVAGQIRFNSDAVAFEGFNGDAWGGFGGNDPLAQTLALLALATP
jgi:hypothetical protein